MEISKDTQMPRRVTLAVFIILAALTVSLGLRAPGAEALMYALPNDSAMRLVTVRDLLNGQGWFDPTQYRLGLDGGFEMHWSRLVDAPLALLILAGEVVTDRLAAERLALIAWPLAVLFASTVMSWRIARTVGGEAAGLAAAVIAWLGLAMNNRFLPGALDHHNVQVLLLLAVVHGAVAHRPAGAIGAGIAMSASLAVGVETLPLLVFCACAIAVGWAMWGEGRRTVTVAFGVSFAASLVFIFGATASQSAWDGGYCDAFSRDLALPAFVGAVLLSIAAALVSGRGAKARFAGLAGTAVVAGGVAVLLTPACLTNPYDALAPELHRLWLDRVIEAQSVFDIIAGVLKLHFLAWYLPGTVALLVALAYAVARRDEALWVIAGLLALALAMALYQLRGATVLTTLAVAPFGILTAEMFRRWRREGARLSAIAAVLAVLFSSPQSWAFVVAGSVELTSSIAGPARAEATGPKPRVSARCFPPGIFDTLAGEPAGVVVSGTDIGTQILLHTHHRVLSAPYHRNEDGMLAAFGIATARGAEEALASIRRFGVTHVVTCSAMPETRALKKLGHDGFFAALEEGRVPAWLTEITPTGADSASRLFRVEDPDNT